MSEFYDRVRALNASHPPLVIPNFSLEDIYDPYTCANERGDGTECAWNSEAMFVMGNHTDGLLSEAGFTAYANGDNNAVVNAKDTQVQLVQGTQKTPWYPGFGF